MDAKASKDETYEGWTNRETWAVALHINNDQGWQESVHEALANGPYASEAFTLEDARSAFYNAPRSVEHMAGEIIRENVEDHLAALLECAVESGPCILRDAHCAYDSVRNDIGSLWRVDWDALGASFLSDIEDES